MKISSSIKLLIALVFSASLTPFTLAREGINQEKSSSGPAGALIKADAAGVSADWLANAKAAYPADRCPVSTEKLEDGDMGPPQDYVYRQDGMPDRLVRFCCNGCVRDFKKTPAQYLKAIDDAAATKAKVGGSK